jgi:hypothetical protein
MNGKLLLAGVIFAVVPGLAFAGSCAAPTVIDPQSPNGTIAGDTCTGGETGQWSFNGLAWPHRSEVYRFTYNNNASGLITIGPAPIEVVILDRDTCVGAEAVLISSQAASMNLADAGLTNGQDYLILVGAENTQAAGTCGTFTLGWESLPVELQSFSVD